MFTPLWVERAVNELTHEWIEADSHLRRSISAAAKEIDNQLRNHAESLGESRSGTERVHFITPLGFTFRISDDRRFVYVLHIWRTDRRRGP